ncbi:MAG: DEAD/DEAH box helicase [Deltaproteobacteria bacterium]|nr:DEAD/DEAH box helicase [Deltaproteobacteria bacterium]
MSALNPGSIVRCRNRDWVLLPSDNPELIQLRPLTGADDEIVALQKQLSDLIGYTIPEERVQPATFPLPTVNDLSDAASAHLLWQAARLTLREGATPFRSLGRVSIRPRTYQFVPLLMALRLDPVRLLIADDVGVGKTIEALLIARELLDRGEIKRVCVLCPPYLCEQWQTELQDKFSLESVLIRSGTVNQLERRKTSNESIYRHYPIQVASIDFVKSDRNRHLFLLDCPELVIVDEAHGSASATNSSAQHQRHELVEELAANQNRHVILLTATPHSGVEAAFQSLLSLLRPEFADWQVGQLTEPQRIELARHFVQRTRRDIERDWEGQHCFPTRDPADEPYALSPGYRELFSRTYGFCSEMVRTGQTLARRQQRVRYWAALALLRCVMSSPAAAVAALERRHDGGLEVDEETEFQRYVLEPTDEQPNDGAPTPAVESAEATLPETERRQLRDLARLAGRLTHDAADTKLARCTEIVASLLRNGLHPIVWCRYIATADYVATGLQRALRSEFREVRVVAVTGTLGDDERRVKIDELAQDKCRVLVATDCLSEGINLQDAFNAALHYDLPWNPNRLEQREGRVDRFGQRAPTVKTIRFFSPENPVDGVVLDVLLNKAREIHRTLGTHVPVPAESETVTQAVLNALFLRRGRETPAQQLQLAFDLPEVNNLHRRWDLDAAREKENRTRFAQRALKPDEVRRELEATDAVLGDPEAVRSFVLNAAQRIGLSITPDRRTDVFRIAGTPEARATLPAAIDFVLPKTKSGHWPVSFVSPTPEGAEYLGRNHRFVATLAQFLMEEALTKAGAARATRCGVIRTRAVERLTTLYLLRVRFLVEQPERTPLLAEEVQVVGQSGVPENPAWLSDDDGLRLLEAAQPDANVPMAEKQELTRRALDGWARVAAALPDRIQQRAEALAEAHRRIRQAVSLKVRGLTVKPQLPPDLLGLLVLTPAVL